MACLNFPKSIMALVICQILCLVVWAENPTPREMDMWRPDGAREDDTAATWYRRPTYVKTLNIPATESVTYSSLLGYAQEMYLWAAQTGRNCKGGTGTCLVAAFHSPGLNQIFASTVPRPDRISYMVSNHFLAPVWYSKVKSLIEARPRNPQLHAEDSAYFAFEDKWPSTFAADKYPDYSMVAVWGFDWPGNEAGPCKGYGGRRSNEEPSCKQIAGRLNVLSKETWSRGPAQLACNRSRRKERREDGDDNDDDATEAFCSQLANSTSSTTSPESSTQAPSPTTAAPSIGSEGAVAIHAGTSHVHVGTLTGDPLYTSVSSALESLCPTASQTTEATVCSTEAADISGIDYGHGKDAIKDGKLVVNVQSSSYNSTDLRDAMIQSAAMSAKVGATGRNCYNKTSETSKPSRRKRQIFDGSPLPHPLHEREESATFCNTVGFAAVYYYDPKWHTHGGDATDWLDMYLSFEHLPESNWDCEVVREAIDQFAPVAPKFDAAKAKLGQPIDFLCDNGEQ